MTPQELTEIREHLANEPTTPITHGTVRKLLTHIDTEPHRTQAAIEKSTHRDTTIQRLTKERDNASKQTNQLIEENTRLNRTIRDLTDRLSDIRKLAQP